jgi:alginate O-acetyltransferase complex protein AlgI
VLFNSLTFLVFFCCVFAAYQLLSNWTAKKILLLAASYVFYAAWYPPFVFILAFSTTMDWWLARRLDTAFSDKARKALLIVSITCNLGLLGFFKYGDFFLENLREVASLFGLTFSVPTWNILLPIGISFYTFASLSYTIDVYRREIRAKSIFLDYALFVSFFPHLVAGPIVRARMLVPQFEQPRIASGSQIRWGLVLLCFGLFAKTVLADSVFAPLVEQVYASPATFGARDTWAAILGFSGQIYFDFSGYSLCAIGLALCFGFEFPDNFRYPYAARGFSDFWHRWHITLSTWLRDYLYIPLGGNRHGPRAAYRNLFLTMLIGGIWHGASWMFVLWGGLHGVYLAAERWIKENIRYRPLNAATSFAATLLIFLIVTMTWIPFRAPNLISAWQVLSGLVRTDSNHHLSLTPVLLAYFAVALTLAWQLFQRDQSLEGRFEKLSATSQTVLVSCCLIAIFLCSGGDERAFIYFQF